MSSRPEQQPARQTAWILGGIFLLCLAMLTYGLHSLTKDNNLGIDYYIYYVAGRTLFIEGGNPYSDEVAEQVQWAVLKRLARPDEDQLGFVYPIYAFLPSLPTLWMTYEWAQAFWLALNILTLVASLLFTFPRARQSLTVFLVYPFLFALLTGNYNVLITSILITSFSLLANDSSPSTLKQLLFGAALAWATAKPQFAWLWVVFYLLWMLRRRMWHGLAAFGASLLLFVGLSFTVMPAWLPAWAERLTKYTEYNQTWLILTLFLKEFVPTLIAQSITLFSAIVCAGITLWLFFRWWKGLFTSLQIAGWCGFILFLFHPHGAAYEQIPFLLPILFWVCIQHPPPRLPAAIFWGGSIILSWIFFFLSRTPGMPASIAEWPFFLFIGWLMYIFKKPKGGMV